MPSCAPLTSACRHANAASSAWGTAQAFHTEELHKHSNLWPQAALCRQLSAYVRHSSNFWPQLALYRQLSANYSHRIPLCPQVALCRQLSADVRHGGKQTSALRQPCAGSSVQPSGTAQSKPLPAGTWGAGSSVGALQLQLSPLLKPALCRQLSVNHQSQLKPLLQTARTKSCACKWSLSHSCSAAGHAVTSRSYTLSKHAALTKEVCCMSTEAAHSCYLLLT